MRRQDQAPGGPQHQVDQLQQEPQGDEELHRQRQEEPVPDHQPGDVAGGQVEDDEGAAGPGQGEDENVGESGEGCAVFVLRFFILFTV